MTSQFPPAGPPPRRFMRSRHDRVIGGVCGGAAAYLNMDTTLVRVLTVVLSVFFPVTVLAYVVLLFALPEEPPAGPPPQVSPGHPDPVWGAAGAPWEQNSPPAAYPQPQSSPQARPEPPRTHPAG